MFSLFGTASRRIQHYLVRRWPSPDKSCHITFPEFAGALGGCQSCRLDGTSLPPEPLLTGFWSQRGRPS